MLRLGSVLTVLLVTALPAQAESVADRVAAILVSQRSPERPTQEALVKALVPLGPELLAPAFEVLALRTVPVAGEDPQVLSEPQRDVLLAAFEALGHAPVASAAQAWRLGRKDLDTTCARLWIYSAIGTAPDVDAILAFANETDEGDRRRVEPPLRHALTATLARDPRALDRFARTWPTLRADLVSTAVVAVGATRDARGVDLLRQILSARPDQTTIVMSQLRLLGPSPSAEVNATLAQMLRQELNPTDPQRCAAAAIALAVLEDIESVPILVSLLESESEGVKRDCTWALGQLTGMRFPAHPVQ